MKKRKEENFYVADPRIKDYEELIVRKETLLKDAASIQIAYTKEFGELIADVFKEKIECIRLKKTISYCQAQINRGEKVNVEDMNAKINGEMQGYYTELKHILKANKEAKEAEHSEEYEVVMAKKTYRRIAKQIHPDINAKTENTPELSELWNKVMMAYHKNDVDTLEDLEVLINKVLSDLGEEGFEVNVTDLEKKIERLEKQITDIVTTKPYTYSEILDNEEEMKKHRKAMERELEEYKNYSASLNEMLEKLLEEGGGSFTWVMN